MRLAPLAPAVQLPELIRRGREGAPVEQHPGCSAREAFAFRVLESAWFAACARWRDELGGQPLAWPEQIETSRAGRLRRPCRAQT